MPATAKNASTFEGGLDNMDAISRLSSTSACLRIFDRDEFNRYQPPAFAGHP